MNERELSEGQKIQLERLAALTKGQLQTAIQILRSELDETPAENPTMLAAILQAIVTNHGTVSLGAKLK
jgi:hypothetical protein